MNEWKVKSESDTDIVFHELDRRGRETGQYRYADKVGGDVAELHVPGRAPKKRVWPWAISAAVLGAAATWAAQALG